MDRGADRLDDFACEAAEALRAVFGVGWDVESDFFQEDGDALNGLGAERTLGCGKLEGIGDFPREGMRRYSGGGVVLLRNGGRGVLKAAGC